MRDIMDERMQRAHRISHDRARRRARPPERRREWMHTLGTKALQKRERAAREKGM